MNTSHTSFHERLTSPGIEPTGIPQPERLGILNSCLQADSPLNSPTGKGWGSFTPAYTNHAMASAIPQLGDAVKNTRRLATVMILGLKDPQPPRLGDSKEPRTLRAVGKS
jgi:hypothetical protein